MHKSYDLSTGETHYDKFDIDFIRYTKLPNIIFNIIGSTIMTIVWISNKKLWNYTINFPLKNIVYTNIIGALLFFILLLIIANSAVNNILASGRLVGRRGLFSYTMITFVVIIGLVLAEKITSQGIFSDSLRMIMAGQIVCSLLAVPLDYISTTIFFKDHKKNEIS